MIHRHDAKQLTYYEHSSPISFFRANQGKASRLSRLILPDIVVTLHKNSNLQIIKMDKKTSDVHVIEDPAIKEVQAILFDEMFLFMVTPKRILVAKNFTEIFDISIGNHGAISI